LHYDFRIEIGGVLKSWAVPKGLPIRKGDKRLAMQVEDHPADYAGFEGIIPSGNYGAGTVMLWEAGICEVFDEKPQKALRDGKLKVHLHGKKLDGHWTLVRMKSGETRDENAWLLIKSEEDARPISARAEDRSVLSGRSMKQIATQRANRWEGKKPSATKRAPARAAA
jgi:bifunctional non-homologous end joining protein LigD